MLDLLGKIQGIAGSHLVHVEDLWFCIESFNQARHIKIAGMGTAWQLKINLKYLKTLLKANEMVEVADSLGALEGIKLKISAGSNSGCCYRWWLREVAPVIKLWMWRLCCKWLSSWSEDYVGFLVVEMLFSVICSSPAE
ncbi:hypothetical protein ACSQ67_023214 [Phaseolus vulgaris]